MDKRIGTISLLFFGVVFALLIFCGKNEKALGVDCSLIVDSGDRADCEKGNDKLDNLQGQVKDVQKDLTTSQTLLTQKQIEANKTQSELQKTATEISRKEAEVENLNSKIELDRKILESYIREFYLEDQNFPLMQIVLSDYNLNDIYDNQDNLVSSRQKVSEMIKEIKDSKDQVVKTKEELDVKKTEHAKLLAVQKQQQVAIKADISEAQATLEQLNAKINKLKSELTDLLGANVSFDDVMKAAKFAADETGIRKDFLLGMLAVESDLGRYTGGCSADKSKMSGTRLSIFKDICNSLDYNWKTRKVSCPPSNYKGTGGAMGVAQFMSDTWMGYKSQITSVTGHGTPDPWSLTDGVVAMALKLARGGATSKSGECNAAKLYLSGTTSKTYNWYCDRVSYWSKNYEDKL